MGRVEVLQRELGRLEDRLELTILTESTSRAERDRLVRELREERAERRGLRVELREARWRRMFRG